MFVRERKGMSVCFAKVGGGVGNIDNESVQRWSL